VFRQLYLLAFTVICAAMPDFMRLSKVSFARRPDKPFQSPSPSRLSFCSPYFLLSDRRLGCTGLFHDLQISSFPAFSLRFFSSRLPFDTLPLVQLPHLRLIYFFCSLLPRPHVFRVFFFFFGALFFFPPIPLESGVTSVQPISSF